MLNPLNIRFHRGYINTAYLDYLNHALQCYQDHKSAQDRCQRFVQPTLAYFIDAKFSYPFTKSICKTQNDHIFIKTPFWTAGRRENLCYSYSVKRTKRWA